MREVKKRFRDAAGNPLVEGADAFACHLLELRRGATAEISPAQGVEIQVYPERTEVILWLYGKRFAELSAGGEA